MISTASERLYSIPFLPRPTVAAAETVSVTHVWHGNNQLRGGDAGERILVCEIQTPNLLHTVLMMQSAMSCQRRPQSWPLADSQLLSHRMPRLLPVSASSVISNPAHQKWDSITRFLSSSPLPPPSLPSLFDHTFMMLVHRVVCQVHVQLMIGGKRRRGMFRC